MRHRKLTRILFVSIAAAVACSSEQVFVDEGLEPANRAPALTASVPPDAAPALPVGQRVEFSVRASDPDGDPLSFEFYLDDSLVATRSSFTYVPAREGFAHVRVVVSDGRLSVSRDWLATVTPDSVAGDTIAPAQVPIVGLEPGPQPATVVVRWLAVGDDGLERRAGRYIVATSNLPIRDHATWLAAEKSFADGSLSDAGTPMALTVRRPDAAQYTAAVVRAVDDAGNTSALGPYAEGVTRGYSYSGRVLDLLTGDPIEHATVTAGARTVLTGPDGGWSFSEMPFLTSGIAISDDGVPGEIGPYYDYRIDDANANGAFHLVYLFPAYPLESRRYAGFLSFFLSMTEPNGTPYPTYLRHFDLPIRIYAPPFTRGGLDYKATIERVATALSARLGFVAFEVADSAPDMGVVCTYDENTVSDHYGVREWTEDWRPVKGEVVFRTIWSAGSEDLFARIIRHELGHALGLRHSTDAIHLMVGGNLSPQVDDFSTDEVHVLTLIHRFVGEIAVGAYRAD